MKQLVIAYNGKAKDLNFEKQETKWTTQIIVNGELFLQDKLTINEIKKLEKFMKELRG
jgi:hypothetical protein